jgi:hypothetical protein
VGQTLSRSSQRRRRKIRQIFEADDLGENFTPELRAQEERLMAKIEKGTSR